MVLVFWIFGAVAIYFLLFEGRPDGEVDAIYWAAMMITGMGPPVLPDDGAVAAKLFLSCYSVAAAFLLLTAAGFALQPVFARVLHIFHLDDA